MDISSMNAAAAKALQTNTPNPETDTSKRVDTQSSNIVALPSASEQRSENLRAASNQQVPQSNASNEPGEPGGSTSKPVVADKINQALVQNAISKSSGSTAQASDLKEAADKKNSAVLEAKTDAARANSSDNQAHDGATDERVKF